MSRLVLPLDRSTRDVHRAYQKPDQYQDRVAKYIPAEVVGGYVSLDGILAKTGAAKSAAVIQFTDSAWAQTTTMPVPAAAPTFTSALISSLTDLPGLIFLFCLVLAPLYVWVLARRTGSSVWKAQAAIAAFAFVVWAYAIKGTVFFSIDPSWPLNKWAVAALSQPQFYNPQWGAALLVLFSLAVAFYQPKAD